MSDEPYDDEREDETDALPSEAAPAPRLLPPMNWWTLAADEKAVVLTTLDRFLRNLHRYYELRSGLVRECWFKHPAVVQEVLALWQYRSHHAFIPDQTAIASLEFHIQLIPALDRIEKATKRTGCQPGEHKEYEVLAMFDHGPKSEGYTGDLRKSVDELERSARPGRLR